MVESYDVQVVPRGYAIIIVNTFENSEWKRNGANQEVDKLKNMFDTLGLTPEIHTDLTKQQILLTLNQYSKRPELAEQSMIAIAISSHGGEHGIYGIDVVDKNSSDHKGRKACAIEAQDIRSIFNSHYCPLLKDKPKLLFLNACRGSNVEEAFKVDGVKDDTDFLTVFSSISGYVSMRDPVEGSVFIQVLCETLLEYNGHDIIALIAVVNSALMKKTSQIKKTDGVNVNLTETCEAKHDLTKKLCLKKV